MSQRVRTVTVNELTRVEGEGALRLVIEGDRVERAELNIYEPPRFFEAFLRGRARTEPPDITSRICGICPVAYQTSACNAIEQAYAMQLDEPLVQLRRLLYCGEWISSHTLHIYLLHAPDFLGYPDAIALARDHREAVERGLALKKAGNAIMDQLGGRAIHPVNVRVGGFYRTPHPREFNALAEQLRHALDDALKTVEWASGFDFPDAVVDHDLFALTAADRYAIEDGVPTATGDRRIPLHDFESRVVEHQVPHSTALHATLDGRRFLTGPLARYSLNSQHLSPLAAESAAAAGLGPECRNPFQSILVRAVEVVYAVDEALRILAEYELPERPAVPLAELGTARVGRGVSEAPRGLLYHRYEISPQGLITTAAIVPPTSQNQSAIEDDLRSAAQANLHLDDASLAALCERIIRNYDPCISCSAHFLDLTVERR